MSRAHHYQGRAAAKSPQPAPDSTTRRCLGQGNYPSIPRSSGPWPIRLRGLTRLGRHGDRSSDHLPRTLKRRHDPLGGLPDSTAGGFFGGAGDPAPPPSPPPPCPPPQSPPQH